MKEKYLLFIFTLIFSQIIFAQDIDSLLNELARKDDLSVQTKKDTSAYITVFTREDLDRMKIRSLDELIDKIPFLKNKLDNMGLNDPYYQPVQVNSASKIRFFINEREILTPLFGSGLRLLGQIDISYIDHIEVYTGVPSFEVAHEPSIAVIKAYTKIGKRENITSVGSSLGSNGTYNAYGYKSEKLKNYSYFTYINRRDLKRDKVQNLGKELSRDKKSTHAYGQFSNENSNFEIQAIDGSLDAFGGNSWNMAPENEKVDYNYLSTSYSSTFLDNSLKATFSYSYLESDHYESSIAPLGFLPVTIPTVYNRSEINLKEHLFDAKFIKKYEIENTSFLFGISNRYKKFNFDKYELDGVDYSSRYTYDSENILSVFTNIDYIVNKNNHLILSLTAEKYFENAQVEDDNEFGLN